VGDGEREAAKRELGAVDHLPAGERPVVLCINLGIMSSLLEARHACLRPFERCADRDVHHRPGPRA
jgi:hypothetical protein